MEYLSLPLTLREGYLPRSNVEDSIMNSIGLILSTRIGSIPFNPEYGCGVWEKEFSDLYTANKADVRASIRNAVDRFEKRLYNLSVSFSDLEGSAARPIGIAVKVTGNYKDEEEEKAFEGIFTVG